MSTPVKPPPKRHSRWLLAAAVFLLLLLPALLLAQMENEIAYLPAVYRPLPTPTPEPTAVPRVPETAGEIPLTGALCPNKVGVNEFSGFVYVANSFSGDVSIVKDDQFLKNVPTGKFPTDIASVPNSPRTYVTSLTNTQSNDQIALFEGADLIQKIPEHFEPHDVIVNPVNGLTYVTDLDSHVRVINGTDVVTDILLPGAGWIRSIAVDPVTGLVYTASWEKGTMYVLQDTQIVASFQAGWGTIAIEVDPVSGFIYVAHSDPSAVYPNNITVFHRNDYTVTYMETAARSYDVAVDPLSGLAYFTNHDDDTVTVMRGRQLVTTVPVGEQPWGAAVDPTTGYAFIANHGSNNVTIMKDGAIVSTAAAGNKPIAIGVDTRTHTAYVANRTYRIDCDDVDRCKTVCRPPTLTILR